MTISCKETKTTFNIKYFNVFNYVIILSMHAIYAISRDWHRNNRNTNVIKSKKKLLSFNISLRWSVENATISFSFLNFIFVIVIFYLFFKNT